MHLIDIINIKIGYIFYSYNLKIEVIMGRVAKWVGLSGSGNLIGRPNRYPIDPVIKII